jgi:hypothetical protein
MLWRCLGCTTLYAFSLDTCPHDGDTARELYGSSDDPPDLTGADIIAAGHVDARDYGAIGDYVVATGAGTDNTGAIQAAIDATTSGEHVGKKVFLPPGRYKTTAPITMYQSTQLIGGDLLRTAALSQGGGGTTIEFHGDSTENCIQAVGTVTSASRILIQGFRLIDRRVSPVSGDGVYFEEVVNQTVIRGMDFFGFPTGAAVRVTATTGNSSDCITIEDLWTLGCGYGVYLSNYDNTVLIRDIKADTSGTPGLTQGVIYLGGSSGAAVLIEGVKHENQDATVPTIILDGVQRGVQIDSVVSRTGVGGPVVKIVSDPGIGITLRNLTRSHSGVMVDVAGATTPYQITTTRLGYWTGGSDGYRINTAVLHGGTGASDNDRIYLTGKLVGSATAPAGGDDGKVFIQRDSTSQKALVVYGGASASVDLVRFFDSSGTAFTVNSSGNTIMRALQTNGARIDLKRTTVADANYTILATDFRIDVTSLTAPRTLTLPNAGTVGNGFRLIIKDKSGAAGTHNITVQRATAPQNIDGAASVAISTNYGVLRLISDGSVWDVI